jgi:riboflavin kinase/FMN adenylyltransferase
MRVFKGFEEAVGIKNPVVTTGSFDGVHLGHKKILDRLNKLAEKYNGESVLITFDPHPRKVLYPDSLGKDLRLISTREEKLQLLKEAGLDNVIIVEFTKEFSKITSEQFVSEYLSGILKAKVIVAGFNHHFGFNKEGDYKQLWQLRQKYHFEAEEIPEQEVQHETVSSTKIRQAVTEGAIQRANAYLDHYYTMMGETEEFAGSIDLFSMPLLKIPVPDETKLLPAPGIYAVSVSREGHLSKGMVIILNNFQTDRVLLHNFIKENNLPGLKLTIYFHKKISEQINTAKPASANFACISAMKEIDDLIY